MTTAASFYVFSVTRASNANSVLTSYTVTLKQEAALPAGSLLFITFPTEISMTSASACTDLAGTALTCTQTSYQDLIVTLPAVVGSAQYGVIITKVQNPASYRPTTSGFSAQVKTSDQISIYTSQTLGAVFSNDVPSSFVTLSYTFTPGSFGGAESLKLTIAPSARIVPTYFLVALAPSLTVTTLACNSFVGFTGSCTFSASVVNVTGITGTS